VNVTAIVVTVGVWILSIYLIATGGGKIEGKDFGQWEYLGGIKIFRLGCGILLFIITALIFAGAVASHLTGH
jgi:hypothetical protein